MKTLLYVDDSSNDRFLLECAGRMAQTSLVVKTMEKGSDAIRFLSGEGDFGDRVTHPLPDMIFLDVKMPEMDGFQILEWIRANAATHLIPVVLFSASVIPSDITRGYGTGADYFITKPPQLSTLVDIVRAADQYLSAEPNTAALARFSMAEQRR